MKKLVKEYDAEGNPTGKYVQVPANLADLINPVVPLDESSGMFRLVGTAILTTLLAR